ncbi:histidine kinase [Geoanaerobacter pelophilus]|uniref:histidine kinase n=1 Tax=Geoanaerobacter pelophilus TaxID=60036 RepID=A0ABQ0MDP6_9BACT|nr:histidine kinase [Geoanaerobacter pelophilus]
MKRPVGQREDVRLPASKISVVVLFSAVSIALVMMAASHLMLGQIREEAVRQATRQQESSMSAMWEQMARRGRNFRIEDGKLYVGDYYVLNGDNEIPDRIFAITGSRATIFMGNVRVATNIMRSDGTRAIGTRMIGPAYQAIFREGTRYRGEADILGTPYFTAYDPIRDMHGKIIGALFVGVKQSEYLASYDRINLKIRAISVMLGMFFVLLAVLLVQVRKRSENALQQQLAFQQLLLDTIPSPIFSKDAQGRYNLCNKAFQDYVGAPREELLGKSVFDLWPGELAEQYQKMDQAIMESSGTQIYESQVRYADGTLRDVLFHKASFRDEKGMPGGLVGVILDITERKEAEMENSRLAAQMHQSRMVESLMIQLNHDLNTPLTPLFALLPMIKKQVDDPGLQRMLEICQQCANQIKGLAEKSLDLVRISSGHPQLIPVRLAATAEYALGEVADSLMQRGVACNNEIPADLCVRGSAEQLTLLFKNLLGNAARYASTNGEIKLGAALMDGMVQVWVQDDGEGLDQQHLALVFNEFFKADVARHDVSTQGLGLAICKRIIANHDGRIWAESPGKGLGTTIFFTLNATGAAPEEAKPEQPGSSQV